MFSVLHNRLPGMNQRTQTCWDCVKSCYLFRLDVYYLVADKYKTVYLECSCEREHSPSLKVNTVKMPALHDETSERSRMCYVLRHLSPLVVFFFFFLYTSFDHAGTHTCTRCPDLSLSSPWFCRRDNSVYRGDRLRQARLATCAEVWIYVSHREECTWHCSGTLWHQFVKAVRVALNRSRKREGCFLALVCFPVFSHLSTNRPSYGAINGRKCPWCGYKRTSATRREDEGDLRQRQVTESWGGISWLLELKLRGRTDGWDGERSGPSTLFLPVGASVNGLSHRSVIKDKWSPYCV